MGQSQWVEWMNRYCDGTLSASEKAALERVLLESSQARRDFWEFTSLHGLTHEAAQLRWVSPSQPAAAPVPLPVEWGWGWRLAASLILTAFMVGILFRAYLDREVAVLARAVAAEWTGPSRGLRTGDGLGAGWMQLEKGAVQIRFGNGASMVFEGPARLRLVSSSEAQCRLGQFAVHVPQQARGFTLRMAGCEVVDLGTEFGVVTPPDGPAEVHVFQGSVALHSRRAVERTVQLSQGESVRLEAEGLQAQAASRSGFLSEEDLARWDHPEVRRRHQTWQAASRWVSADPAAILHYTFEGQSAWDRVLTNQVRQSVAESHGRIVDCQWDEGRWPGKKALRFDEATTRVRLQLPQTFRAVTCLIWARVDSLTNAYTHSLMSGDSEGPGTIRWTLNPQGQFRFGVASASAGPEASWAVGIGPSIVSKEQLGQWFQFGAVYEEDRTVRLYRNGERIWSGSVRGPEELSFGWVEIGNWCATPQHPDFQWAKDRQGTYFARQFQGCMDEVAVLTRALSDQEIKRFYESGQPLAPAALAGLR